MKQSEAIRIHNEAVALAQKATAKYLEEHGDDFPCGFAGVKIKPATQSFARQLKKAGIVDHKAWNGGYDIWNPSGNRVQSEYAKLNGAIAYANFLRDNGVNCNAWSKID